MYLRIKTVYSVSSCIQYLHQYEASEVRSGKWKEGGCKNEKKEKEKKDIPSSQPIHQPSTQHQ